MNWLEGALNMVFFFFFFFFHLPQFKSMSFSELVVSSSLDGVVSIWDLDTQVEIQLFKNSMTTKSQMALVKKNNHLRLLISAQAKPLVHYHKRQQVSLKNILNEIISCCEVSNSKIYLFLGSISGILYVYHIKTGILISQQQLHYKKITTIKVDILDEFIYTGSEDTFIKKTNIQKLLSNTLETVTIKGHMLGVTDLWLSNTINTKVYSSSEDRTVRISSYDQMKMISFPRQLSCLTVDTLERYLFVGGVNGVVYLSVLQKHKQEKEELLKYETKELTSKIEDLQMDARVFYY
jgi:WD40 repeat protein